MTYKCDWPGCEAQTESWRKDGWCTCFSHADVSFLPDPCLLCPTHGQMYEEIACDPGLLARSEGRCIDCGEPLSEEEIGLGHEQCFACFSEHGYD
jgi:hypothetical protein